MATVTIDFPDFVLPPKESPADFARAMRLAAALHWYDRGVVSQEKAAAVAGLSRTDFLDALARAEIPAIQVGYDELCEEFERARRGH
jgi:predicted HTH domain antitoxin